MNEKIKSTGWVTLLRIIAYVQIVGGCLLSVILGAAIIYGTVELNGASGVALGVVVMLVGVLISFISAAMTMVLLGIADDVHATRVMAERRQ